jgi:hypothetical protein
MDLSGTQQNSCQSQHSVKFNRKLPKSPCGSGILRRVFAKTAITCPKMGQSC